MHSHLKYCSSPNSTILTDEEPSSFTPNHFSKRFIRSNSGSRSKSKEDHKDTDTRGFFVKNICKQLLNNQLEGQEPINRLQKQKGAKPSARKRADTPCKGKRQVDRRGESESLFEQGLQKELQMLRIEKQLKQVLLQNKRLKDVNKCLEQKLNVMSLELAERINQCCFLEQKIKYSGQKEKQIHGKETRNLALAKIKKMISSNDDQQPLSLCAIQENSARLQQHNKQLQADNNRLRETLHQTQSSLKKLQEDAQAMSNQRQNFMNDLVQQLKGELAQKDEMLQKMRIQLNVFLVRQAKNLGKEEAVKAEEMEHMKKKYTRVLKMYHEVSQQLAAYKRKNERMNSFFQNQRSRKNSIDSLTLSP